MSWLHNFIGAVSDAVGMVAADHAEEDGWCNCIVCRIDANRDTIRLRLRRTFDLRQLGDWQKQKR